MTPTRLAAGGCAAQRRRDSWRIRVASCSFFGNSLSSTTSTTAATGCTTRHQQSSYHTFTVEGLCRKVCTSRLNDRN